MNIIDYILSSMNELTIRVNRLEVQPGCRVLTGSGTPQGVISAPVGTIFMRTDGGASTTLYIKETGTGNTGWRAV